MQNLHDEALQTMHFIECKFEDAGSYKMNMPDPEKTLFFYKMSAWLPKSGWIKRFMAVLGSRHFMRGYVKGYSITRNQPDI